LNFTKSSYVSGISNTFADSRLKDFTTMLLVLLIKGISFSTSSSTVLVVFSNSILSAILFMTSKDCFVS